MAWLRLTRYTLLIILLSSNANASPDEAQNFIKSVSGKALEVIKNNQLSDDRKQKDLENLFEKSVDTAWIGKFVLGQYWRPASQDEKTEYMRFYKQFLINSYVPKFKQYTNQEIKFKKSSTEEENTYKIETEIVQPEGPAIRVDYKVRKNTDGSFKIYDVIAEGISLITTQRSEFSSILSRSNLKELIEKLKAKTNG